MLRSIIFLFSLFLWFFLFISETGSDCKNRFRILHQKVHGIIEKILVIISRDRMLSKRILKKVFAFNWRKPNSEKNSLSRRNIKYSQKSSSISI